MIYDERDYYWTEDQLKEEFGLDSESVAEHFLEEDWEYFDVSIRCYLLSQAIMEALDEFDDDDVGGEDE